MVCFSFRKSIRNCSQISASSLFRTLLLFYACTPLQCFQFCIADIDQNQLYLDQLEENKNHLDQKATEAIVPVSSSSQPLQPSSSIDSTPPLFAEESENPNTSSKSCRFNEQKTRCTKEIEQAEQLNILIERTRGLVLVDSESRLLSREELQDIYGLYVESHFVLPGSFDELRKRLDPIYLSQPMTLQKIHQLKKEIQNYFLDNDRPFTIVIVPKQCISTGVLQLVVCQSKVGMVVIEGSHWTKTDQIKKYVRTQPGDPLLANVIQRDLHFLNRNPYRHVNALYSPGQQKCTTDLILSVDERKPCRIYVGADNTGLPRIRRQRLFTGFGLNRILGLDSYINFQYTTAYYPNSFHSYTGQWAILLPWHNILNCYGGYSQIHTELPYPEMKNKGVFTQGSGRYTLPAILGNRFPIECTVGFDFKRTNTTLLFSEQFVNTLNAANLSQFVFDARWKYEGTYTKIELVGEAYYSPGELLANETPAEYDALRPGATPNYVYGKAAFRYTQWLPANFEILLWARGQLSNAPLLPSEQYSLGGHDTVRGYNECQLSMDNALNVNFELRTPGMQIISYIRKMKVKDALQIIGFVDYGVGRNKYPLPGEASPSWLLSAGPGARYTIDPYVAIRVDWGWKLHKKPSYTGGGSMVQFSSTISY